MKKNSNIIKTLISILVVIFIIGCIKNAADVFFSEKQGDFYKFEKLKNEVNTSRKAIIENGKSINISEYTPNFKDELGMFTKEEIESLTTDKSCSDISKIEAVEDVEIVFKLLKYSYGAYEYFGGDKVFNESKKRIIEKISSIDRYKITTEDFEKILISEMQFIKDGHFIIGYSKPCEYQYMYICSEYNPIYERGVYYIEYKDNIKAQIISINNDVNLENYIKLTINNNGEICYGLVSLFENKNSEELVDSMVVKYDNKEETVELKWNIASDKKMDENEAIYEKKIIDGISVYCIYEMYGDENLLKEFSNSAVDAKEEKVFIIDLRGNTGGTDQYADDWFYNYTGNYPDKPVSSGYKITDVGVGGDIKESGYLTLEEIKSAEEGKWNISENKGKWVENENLIIVLTDKNVASAGEDMIANLKTIKNVIFIGSNSAGCYLSAANSSKYLPNSGIYLNYGYGIILNNDGKNIDGTGFLPDLWVQPSQALELALKTINFYKLK